MRRQEFAPTMRRGCDRIRVGSIAAKLSVLLALAAVHQTHAQNAPRVSGTFPTASAPNPLGVIGRYIVEKLVEAPDWRVVGLSRRKTTDGPCYRHIAVDLLDPEDTKRKLAELTDVTDVFYAAFQATPGSAADFASNTGPNREMLVNSVTAINRAAPHLKRVVLVTGTKFTNISRFGPVLEAKSAALPEVAWNAA